MKVTKPISQNIRIDKINNKKKDLDNRKVVVV